MAEWLKVNHTLVRSPKIRLLMRELRCSKMTALGLAISWLCWIDEQTTDGQTHLSPDELAEEIGFRGGVEALFSIGWAALGEDGCVVALEFGKHCGDSAKKRAEDARRQANKRKRDAEMSHETSHEMSRKNCDICHTECVTRIEYNSNNTRDELSSTVVTRAAVEPGSPPMRLEERAEFGRWLCRLGEVVPMLQRLNLNHPLPRKVEEEAQQAYRLVPLSEATLRLIGRYYAAEAVKSYRPDSLEFFFRDLPDVLQHAANWCRWADKQQLKAEATARRKAAEAAQGVVGEGSPMVSAEEAAEAFREMRR